MPIRTAIALGLAALFGATIIISAIAVVLGPSTLVLHWLAVILPPLVALLAFSFFASNGHA